ncbi:uncharacterized protein PSANT_01588 [Moesziomyces antarcticus]|uniref:Ribosomal protein L9 domain-containing protein n=2 Tax=Pseudozyma antarctica TaxID=84753 RepID=A0A5C3FHN4_PSEA2|nr:uncharacterized protein PSANT_01588 [Moesziomyces antarcticus]
MRSSAVLDLAHTALTLSQRRLVRVKLRKEVPGLGSAGSIVLVQPGRMRNVLLPACKATYEPLPTPFQLSLNKVSAAAVEAQLETAQAELNRQQTRDALSKELGAIQLLSLRRKLEAVPTVVLSRPTTTKYKPASASAAASEGSSSVDADLPRPPLTIQGSIAGSDIVAFLRENGAFDLETDFSRDAKPVQLNRLTAAQINTACEFQLVNAANSPDADAIDKLGRIKKTGRYTLVAHILPSNIRVRIPVVVRPNAASYVASSAQAAVASPSIASMASQSRSYATSATQAPTSMETAMRSKLEQEFGPQVEVNIRNDSSKHAHHAAMAAQGGGNGETHFYVHVVSDKFAGMPQIKRHRAVNALLAGEFERGLHALSLRTKTWAEENRVPAEGQQQAENNIGDGSECPRAPEEGSGSLWTAPESSLHPTSPLATGDILSAFYTPPPKRANVSSARATPSQQAKFFRRVTKHDALEPSQRQNQLNLIGGILAGAAATYMVLFADFGQAGATNCFTDLRLLVWGPEGPPKLF